MKFLCDNCQAQYMISDDKVGPAGVRVRCKKCSHVIFVKKLDSERPTEDSTVVVSKEKMAQLSTSSALEPVAAEPLSNPQSESSATQPPAASQPPAGIEDEIGQALDSMFSDPKNPATASPGPTASGGSRPPVVLGSPPLSGGDGSPFGALNGEKPSILGLDSPELTQIASPSPAANSSPPGTAPKALEWFVAIQDEQVGPLKIEDIKARFEKGEVGSDTLVWSTGLTDWRPLSNVEELAEQILPKKEIVRISRLPIPSEPPKEAPKRETVAFRPSAASALASLASMAKEELATVGRTPSNPPKPADSGGSRAADAIPAGFLAGLPAFTPAPMPAAAPAAEAPRESSAGASLADYRLSPLAQTKPRSRGGGRSFLGVAIVAITVLAGLGAGAYYFMAAREHALEARLDRQQRDDAQRLAAEEKAKQDAQAAAKAAELAAQKVAPAPNPAQPPPVRAPSAPPSVLPSVPPHQAPSPVVATREDPRDKRGKHGKGRGEASWPEPAAQPAAHPDKAPSSKGSDDFLAAGDVDKEFAKELEGGGDNGKASAKHGPYIPPAPGQADLPASLSQSDIVGAVTQRRDAFAKCVQEQKRRDPSATGTVVMRWRIRPDGRSTDIAAKGEDYADSPLASCFKSQIGKLRFGAYRGAQMAPIEFPFSF